MENSHLVKAAIWLHIVNILSVLVLILIFISFIGVTGLFAYLFIALVFFVFMVKEFIHFGSAQRKPVVGRKTLSSRYSLKKIRKMAGRN